MVVEMDSSYKFSSPKSYNFILNNLLLICFILFLICVGIAYSSSKASTVRTIHVFAILYIVILIIWLYLRRSFQAITIDFVNRKIGLRFYRKKDYSSFEFSEIDRIYLSNWLVLVINGKKKYFIGWVSPELIEKLNNIKAVEWNAFAKITYDKQFKRTSSRK